VTIVAYETANKERRYILADSSQYEDPTGVGEDDGQVTYLSTLSSSSDTG